ncbi:MAG TPA: hypothetical protein VM934_07205 [Pyrinomonadaceae bacterium]|jgi:hypothetical protein|nr:hypothetical protein [Pyrinomonadaceae bacterium]
MTIKFSRRLAILFGILIPLGETIRRWHTWQDYPPNFFDDYLIGAFLLYGAWRTRRDVRGGQRYLSAAWGFACAFGYASFFGKLQHLNAPDPAPIPLVWVAGIIGVGWALCIVALLASFRLSENP